MSDTSKTTSARAFITFALALTAGTAAHAQSLATTGVRAVPTYEAAGLYWSSPGAGSNGCDVRYRVSGATAWSTGLNLWFDKAANECRGSIVNLKPGTAYDVQLGVNGTFTVSTAFTTWANTVPVAQTIKVPSGTSTLNITTGGTATGYVVYDGTGSTLDAQNASPTNINVNASYVIVRGFTLKGAQQHGILIDRNQHDVIIEDNDISGWGRTRDGTWGTDMDSGIRAICSNQELTRVTVQRNRIHDPRYPANSWSDGHPAGPQGVTFSYCGGNNVFRWNEIYSAQNHFNDGMGGEDNFSTTGFPNRDSDVYGNRIEMTWDDGLEIEGGNNNVRVWGNYLNNTATGIASTITSVGPLYVFRNVYNRSRFYEKSSPDTDDRQPMFKSGSSSSFANGRRYLFHNTMLQATQSGLQYPLGGGAGVGGTGSTQLVENTVSMNNIYHIWKPNSSVYQIGTTDTFQNDMFNGRFDAAIVGGINATPQYASGNGWQSESGGMYQLAAGTPGYDGGVRIANFNDGYLGNAPDVGAAEAGAPAMKFGIAAASATSSAGGTGTTTTTTGSGTGGTGTSTGSTGSTGGSATPSSGMDSSSYTINAGQSVTFTATVYGNSGTPGGSVNFTSDTVTIAGCGAVALSAGKATCTTTALAGGAHAIRGLYSGDSTYTAGTAGPITQTVTGTVSTSTPAAPTTAPSSATLSNISTRAHVGTGNDVLIGGFIIQGSTNKTVVVTAIGPSLAAAGVAGALPNPKLTLVRASDGAVIATNDDWQSATNAAQIASSGFAPGNPLEPAVLMSLAPGAYTAIVSDAAGRTGVGMVAAYEVDHPETPLVNVSTRGQVLTGNDVMIGGFVIQGNAPQTVVVRSSGPSLAAAGITNPLSNPTLTLVRSSDGAVMATNDDWGLAANAAQLQATGLYPKDPREPAVLVTLPPGAYTAVVSGAGGATGVGTVEVFKTP